MTHSNRDPAVEAGRMTKAAAVACVEQLLGASLRQALPGMEEVADAAASELERANARLVLETARELVDAIERDVRQFQEQGASDAPREGEPRCAFCWRAAVGRVGRVA